MKNWVISFLFALLECLGIVFAQSGNVGIGTSVPVSQLHVFYSGNTAISPGQTKIGHVLIDNPGGQNGDNSSLVFRDDGPGFSWITKLPSGSPMGLYGGRHSLNIGSNGPQRVGIVSNSQLSLIVDSTGNVGIGDANPVARVSVRYNGNSGYGGTPMMHLRNTGGSYCNLFLQSDGNTIGQIWKNPSIVTGYGGSNSVNLGSVEAINIGFVTDNTLRAIINGGDGYFGINVGLNPLDALHVGGRVRINNIPTAGGISPLYANSNGVIVSSASDIRLKQNIQPIVNALPKVIDMRGVTYAWKEDPTIEQVGFIAQEMAEIEERLVFTNPNDDYLGIDYGHVTALLAEAIEELNDKVRKYEARVKALEAMLEVQAQTQFETNRTAEK